jgi:hypothetical protein
MLSGGKVVERQYRGTQINCLRNWLKDPCVNDIPSWMSFMIAFDS